MGRQAVPELERWPRPSVAVDVALLTITQQPRPGLAVLVHRRTSGYGAGRWSLPGTFVHHGETLRRAALRALRTKVGVEGERPTQLQVFDAPDRDDRGWVMSVAHVDLVPDERLGTAVDADRLLAPVLGRPPRAQLPAGEGGLLFDHDAIVASAVDVVRAAYRDRPDPHGLLGDVFTLAELRRVHEAVLGDAVPKKDTFRRLMEPQVLPIGQRRYGTIGAPARLFRRAQRLEE